MKNKEWLEILANDAIDFLMDNRVFSLTEQEELYNKIFKSSFYYPCFNDVVRCIRFQKIDSSYKFPSMFSTQIVLELRAFINRLNTKATTDCLRHIFPNCEYCLNDCKRDYATMAYPCSNFIPSRDISHYLSFDSEFLEYNPCEECFNPKNSQDVVICEFCYKSKK